MNATCSRKVTESGSTGGVIIDSGTSITWLQQDAYEAVRRGLVSAIPLPATNDTDIGLDTCFHGS